DGGGAVRAGIGLKITVVVIQRVIADAAARRHGDHGWRCRSLDVSSATRQPREKRQRQSRKPAWETCAIQRIAIFPVTASIRLRRQAVLRHVLLHVKGRPGNSESGAFTSFSGRDGFLCDFTFHIETNALLARILAADHLRSRVDGSYVVARFSR